MSTTMTLMCGHLYAIIAIVGPPTYPAPMQQMDEILGIFDAVRKVINEQ